MHFGSDYEEHSSLDVVIVIVTYCRKSKHMATSKWINILYIENKGTFKGNVYCPYN